MTSDLLKADSGSFRDRNGRVYNQNGLIFRGISSLALDNWNILRSKEFFKRFTSSGVLIPTERVFDPIGETSVLLDEWAAVLCHERIPFISYPYEWPFGMLKDAALLHIDILEQAILEDMILKDATSYNIQWRGSHPTFIDIPSFEPLPLGTPWAGYRQFCQLFLFPLMLTAYKDVAFQSFLRGEIDGIDPQVFRNFVSFRDLFRPGVIVDVVLQAKLQQRYSQTRRKVKDDLRSVGFRKEMILSNIRRLRKIISRLQWNRSVSEWSGYASANSYSDKDMENKVQFVTRAVASKHRSLVWDIGCNTGTFSRIAAENSDYVVAMDSDHLAVEYLYADLKGQNHQRILPLVINLASPSPAIGWNNKERTTLTVRGTPDLILALALIHHVVIGSNIPMKEFIVWLASLGSDLVIEFVTKEDPMTKILLQNKVDQYADYELSHFEQALSQHFHIVDRHVSDSGTRVLFSGTNLKPIIH